MGLLSRHDTNQRVELESNHLVGRSARCTLQIHDEHVSSEHASLRWTGEAWVLKDLGSLNRTWVNGRGLASSESVILRCNDQIAFGGPGQTWLLLDAGAPSVMAIPEDGGEVLPAIGGLLALPSTVDPAVTVHRDPNGLWVVDSAGSSRHVADQDWIEAGGRRFKISIPQVSARTAPLQGFVGRRVAELGVTFRVSADLEHIELLVRCDARVEHFGARGHNEMLLVLARTRKRDAAQGIPPANAGWMYQDELCRAVALDAGRLNVDVYRVRQSFSELGLVDPASIIERRSKSRQLRIGTDRLEEVSI
jgi:hypothetical protein